MTTGRRQHTIPRFYLNHFLSPGWVYQRGSLSVPRQVKNAEHEAVQSWYYASSSDDSTFSLDGANTQIESILSPWYRKLLSQKLELTSDRKRMLSYLIAHLALRVPAQHRENGSFVLCAYECVDRMVTEYAEKIGKNRATLEAAGSNHHSSGPRYNPSTGGYTYSLRDWRRESESLREDVKSGKAMIETSISFIRRLMPLILDMNWVFFDAPRKYFFITSDRPVFLTRPDGSRLGAGWGNRDSIVSFPLSPQRYLLMSHLESGNVWSHKEASIEEITSLNERTIASAVTTVYSAKEYEPAAKWMRT